MLSSKARPTLQVPKFVNDSLCAWSKENLSEAVKACWESTFVFAVGPAAGVLQPLVNRSHKGNQLVILPYVTPLFLSFSIQLPPYI